MDTLPFNFSAITIIVQKLLICYFANMLVEKNNQVEVAIYQTSWILTPPRFRRQFQLLILRLQKPVRLTAWKFFDITLESFTFFMRNSYQYFTVFKIAYARFNN